MHAYVIIATSGMHRWPSPRRVEHRTRSIWSVCDYHCCTVSSGIHVPVASVRSRDMSVSVCERGSCIIAEMLNTNLVIHWSQTKRETEGG